MTSTTTDNITKLAALNMDYNLLVQQYQSELQAYQTAPTTANYIQLKDSAYWGSSIPAASNIATVGDCQGACAADPNCSGASLRTSASAPLAYANGSAQDTPSPPACALQSGQGSLVYTKNSTAIVKQEQTTALSVLQYINSQLLQKTDEILSLMQTISATSDENAAQLDSTHQQLMQFYAKLVDDRAQFQKKMDALESVKDELNDEVLRVNMNHGWYTLWTWIAVGIAILLVYVAAVEWLGTAVGVVIVVVLVGIVWGAQ